MLPKKCAKCLINTATIRCQICLKEYCQFCMAPGNICSLCQKNIPPYKMIDPDSPNADKFDTYKQ